MADLLFEATAKYGIPYFQNYIALTEPGRHPGHVLPPQPRPAGADAPAGEHVGPGDSTGSIGVVTINLNRIGYEAKTVEEFRAKLEELMVLAKESLETKREVVNSMLKKGLMPYTLVYLGHLTITSRRSASAGLNEACLNFLGKGLRHEGKSSPSRR